MKEQLIEALGLKPDATDAQIVAAVKQSLADGVKNSLRIGTLEDENETLRSRLETRTEGGSREEAITRKINESGGALNREQAILALNNQAEHDAAAKRKGARK